ncbi:4'-phosphopantetheinyl transferase superfamily protein [Barnesiella propionica]|uniref:4'-phosphopantetheinyl transferase superfamily protein n=1 Tax=Barnesiella propionica TaxID=2981781 RepID=UPI0011C709E6|nr:4'-phosphopantetheinyl transferase superfamily protein [Barnesiella propionica]MCU6768490.1 4'-phosphopantetheinyl transferase superfamily protein [Barnesiella propionica]
MSVYEIFVTETDIKIGLWKLTETPEELQALGNNSLYYDLFKKHHTVKRQKEVLASRLLLRQLTGEDNAVNYTASGRPCLQGDLSGISISHTGDIVAVALHPQKNIGIDIEKIGEKISRVSGRFIGREELFLQNPVGLHLAWSIKEALYKAIQAEGIDLIKHLHIHPFELQESGIFTAHETRTSQQYTYKGYYKIYPSFVLACCIQV